MHLRVSDFRVGKTGIARYDLRDPYYAAVTAPWYGFLLGAVGLVLLVNLCFALLYLLRPGAVQNLPAGSLADAFFFSVETMSTVGYGVMAPASPYGHVVATLELVSGLGLTATLTGILFVRLSRPGSSILFADCAVLTRGEAGEPELSIRVANGRLTPLVGASASLVATLVRTDATGAQSWQVHRLPLVESELPLFPMLWTLTHRLSGDSPLAGLDRAGMAATRLKLFLMVAATDPAIGADMQGMQSYDADGLVFDGCYAEALSLDGTGRVTADLSRLSALL